MLIFTRLFEILTFLAFWALLGAAIFMMMSFYVCDNQTCKPFVTASSVGPTGSQSYVLSLLNEFGTDGIWPMPYIGAAILTPLTLWFLKIPINLLNFGVMFFVSFVIIYFMFSFYNHHYVRIISQYTSNYIRNDCPGSTIQMEEILTNNTLNHPTDIPANTISEVTPSHLGPNLSSIFLPICPQEHENLSNLMTESLSDEDFPDWPVKSPKFKPFANDLGITFATPVNIF